MAITFKLRRNTTDMSMQDGSTGAQLVADGWTPRIARATYGRIPPYVEEHMPLLISDSSHDNLAAELQELHQMQQWAAEYQVSRTTECPVWLHAKLANETGERRAFVRSIAADFGGDWFDADSVNNQAHVPIVIERHPYWEETTVSDAFTPAEPSAAVSVTVDCTAGVGDVAGDVPARLAYFSVRPAAASVEVGRLWIGTRSANKHGTLANFANHWECEHAGTTLGTDAARATDATAHPGGAGDTKLTITPGTTTWAKRMTITLGAAAGVNESDNFGNFLWLLRTKVSAGTWEVQLRWGYNGLADADHLRGPIAEVDETSWDIKEMGIAPVPLRDWQATETSLLSDIYEQSYQIQVWARRTVGTGTLDLDVICPVPVDESWLIAKNFTCDASTESFSYSVSPNDRPWAGVFDSAAGISGAWTYIPTISTDPTNLGLPLGDGRFIIVYATTTSSDIADTIAVGGRRYERWLSLRGAE